MSSLYQIRRFENVFEAGQQQDGYDRVCSAGELSTGTLDIHDMAIDSDSRLIFANTLLAVLQH